MPACQFIPSLELTGCSVLHAGFPLPPSPLRQFHMVPLVTQDSLHIEANEDDTQIHQVRGVQMLTRSIPLKPHFNFFLS